MKNSKTLLLGTLICSTPLTTTSGTPDFASSILKHKNLKPTTKQSSFEIQKIDLITNDDLAVKMNEEGKKIIFETLDTLSTTVPLEFTVASWNKVD